MRPQYRLRLLGQVCSLTYGTSPCNATTEGDDATGSDRCYNTRASCQDPANYAAAGRTYSYSSEPLAGHRNLIREVRIKAGDVAPEGVGGYSECEVVLNDSIALDQPADDKYGRASESGTYWGRLLARQPGMRTWTAELDIWDAESGLRTLGSSWRIGSADFEREGTVRLRLVSPDRDELSNLFPAPSTAATTGDSPAAGIFTIPNPPSTWATGALVRGGSEICEIDILSGTAVVFSQGRGYGGSERVAHPAGTVFQLCEEVSGKIGEAVKGMLTGAGIPSSRIDSASFTDYDTNVNPAGRVKRLFSEPQKLRDAIAEICFVGQCGLIYDVFLQKYRLIGETVWSTSTGTLGLDDIEAGTFSSTAKPAQQITSARLELQPADATDRRDYQVIVDSGTHGNIFETVYGGLREQTFRTACLGYGTGDIDSALESTGKTAMGRLVRRYGRMPSEVRAEITGSRAAGLRLGQVFDITFPDAIQDFSGAADVWRCMLVEMNIGRLGLTRVCRFLRLGNVALTPSGVEEYTLRTGNIYRCNLFDELSQPPGTVSARVIIPADTVCYSDDPAHPGLLVAGFAAGSRIEIINNGYVWGGGGLGGGKSFSKNGGAGGPAVRIPAATLTVSFDNRGTVYGGSGGGGRGQGYQTRYWVPPEPGEHGTPGFWQIDNHLGTKGGDGLYDRAIFDPLTSTTREAPPSPAAGSNVGRGGYGGTPGKAGNQGQTALTPPAEYYALIDPGTGGNPGASFDIGSGVVWSLTNSGEVTPAA